MGGAEHKEQAMKNTQEIEEQEAPQEEPSFALYNIRRDQIILTGSTLAATGILDVAFHASPTGVFFGLLGTFVVGGLSNEILDRVIPGRHLYQTGAHQTVPALASFDPSDQSTRAKLSRLFRFHRSHGVVAQDDVEEVDEEEDEHPQSAAAPLQRLFPLYKENETLRLGRVAATGQRFDPHFNQLLGNGLIIAAVQGSGKSIINGLLIERSGPADLPVVALDHKGEYDSVTELSFVNGFRAGMNADSDFHLTPENAGEFVRQVMENRYQAIVNLPSYGDSWIARAEIVAAVGKALMAYAAQQRRLKQPLLPCLVIVDEAQLYFPENVSYLPAEARNNKDVLNDLSNAYFSLVSNGRSNGYTMCFATQSLTFIAKAMIKSCQIKMVLRHVEKNDLDECKNAFSPHVTREQFETFPAGYGVVAGFTPFPMVVQFDMKKSRDMSETPKLDRLRAPRPAVMPPVPMRTPAQPQQLQQDQQAEKMTAILAKSMSLDQLLTSIKQMPDQHRGEDVDEAPPSNNPYPDEPQEAEHDPLADLPTADRRKAEWALQLWEEGFASVRKLRDVSGWSDGETRRVIKLLRDRGLVGNE